MSTNSLAVPVLTGVLIAAFACTIERGDVRTPGGEAPEADTLRVRKAIETVAVAFESGDLATLDSLVHDSVMVYENGRVDRGWVVYRDQKLLPRLRILNARRLRLTDIRVRLAGSTAWATCRFDLSANRSGETVSARGVGTMVFQRLSGRWRLVHWHMSARDADSSPP
jgi:ketosteroid isomerase-like protein